MWRIGWRLGNQAGKDWHIVQVKRDKNTIQKIYSIEDRRKRWILEMAGSKADKIWWPIDIGMRKWKEWSVTPTCSSGGALRYIHKEADHVCKKENEFHFRHVEGLREHSRGDDKQMVRSLGLEFKQDSSWSERSNFRCHIPKCFALRGSRGICWFMLEGVEHLIKNLLIHSFHKYLTASSNLHLSKTCQTQHG